MSSWVGAEAAAERGSTSSSPVPGLAPGGRENRTSDAWVSAQPMPTPTHQSYLSILGNDQISRRSSGYSGNWNPSATGAQEGSMISPDPRRFLGLARRAESYEAKCERRQEARESRRCRPNVTMCRQAGRVLRTQQREQVRSARQLQFFRRRNLEAEETGQAQRLWAREQGPCRRAGRTAVFEESRSYSRRTTSPAQQEKKIRTKRTRKYRSLKNPHYPAATQGFPEIHPPRRTPPTAPAFQSPVTNTGCAVCEKKTQETQGSGPSPLRSLPSASAARLYCAGSPGWKAKDRRLRRSKAGSGARLLAALSSHAGCVTGTSSEAFPIQGRPPSSVHRDLADLCSSQAGALLPRDSPIKRPPKRHCGTQTKADDTQPAIKNDASLQTNSGVAVLDKEIIQLSEYLKEALQRELVLKQKMVILQDLLSTLIQASDSSWKASCVSEPQAPGVCMEGQQQGQLNEDKLKGRLRSLENQLYACTQKYSPWGMKKVLLEMEDQKNSYEQKAKESLQKVLEEKMGAEQQLQSTQRALGLAEQKCEEWRSQYEALKEDWRTLGAQHRELESQLHGLRSKLQGADSRDAQMNQALRLLENEHQELQAKIECLQGDQDLYNSDSRDLQDQLKRSEEEKLALVTRVQQLQSLLQNQSSQLHEQEKLLQKDQALPVWTPKPSPEVEPESTGKDKDWDLRDQLQKKTLQLRAKEQECTELHSELDNLRGEYLSCLHKLQRCREELNRSLQLPPRRRCGRWLPMLMVVIAAALAVFLANKDSLMI